MDDLSTLSAANSDPISFLNRLPDKTIIDEIQRALGLLIPIKKIVDENRIPGRYLLTGSANVLILPKTSESLAGRIEVHTLWPLSQGEIQHRQENSEDNILGHRRTCT